MKEGVLEKLEQYNQEHLIQYLPLLTEEEKQLLEQQVLQLDFEKISKLYETTKQEVKIEEKEITHIPYIDKEKLSVEEREKLQNIAKGIISEGKYAVVTMAGGQGTRLRIFRTKRKLCTRNDKGKKIFI